MSSNGRYWIFTVPVAEWNVPEHLPSGCLWLKGQQELSDSGYAHWQFIAGYGRNVRLPQAKSTLGLSIGHAELTRSDAADQYVWKDDTSVPGTRFELGCKPLRRNVPKDWDRILAAAKLGDFDSIPSDIVVRCYPQLSRIAKDFMAPVSVERTVFVFWGRTGTGKSRRAWEEASLDAYPKDPSTKWWDGYRGQQHVVLDEFRGRVAIEHLLRWFDRYPVCVETKGGAVVLRATRIWITSNLSPDSWFPDVDEETRLALRRRLNITHYI